MSEQPVFQILDHFDIRPSEIGDGEVSLLCPFHEESSPSLGIELKRGYWNCFGCGAKGDLIEFVARVGKLDRLKAMMLIRKLQGREVRTELAEAREAVRRVHPAEDFRKSWGRFVKVDWEKISEKQPVAAYLIGKRGYSRGTLQAFDVRLTKSQEYPVVFPVVRNEELIGFVRRRIDRQEENKYLYNEGFNAQRGLAYYKAGGGPMLVVEGVLDLMKAAQFGCRHAAALLSWRITRSKAMWLRARGVTEVVCALDNTPTGEEGAELLRQCFPSVYQFRWPGKHRKDIGDLSSVHEFVWGWPA